MSITLQPTETEFVDIIHGDWGARWSIQFPEAIGSADGTIRAWPTIRPDWQRVGTGAWGYTWRPPADYAQQVQALDLTTPEGRPHYTQFVRGAELRTQIATDGREIELSLTITNLGDQPLQKLHSDGGCLQARSEAFTDGDEVARSYVGVGGAMISMGRLPRSEAVRYRCLTEPASEANPFEWFWGRTATVVDAPAVVGAVSRDGARAIVLGYEQARVALQNADSHHCLHSGPWFGELMPGQSATRRGWILFGDDIQALARELSGRAKRSS